MNAEEMLASAKLALRITTDAFDNEILELLIAALQDLGVAGVVVPQEYDYLVRLACVTFVKLHFGQMYERSETARAYVLKQSYDEQKAQLVTCTGYTDWKVAE